MQSALVVPNALSSTASGGDDSGGDGGDDSSTSYTRLLQPGHYYDFSVKLKNFLGFAASSSPFRVVVASGAIPNVIITAGQQYNTLVPMQLSIFAQASLALCPGDRAGSASLTYVWTCSREGAVSTSVDPRYFKLDPFSLNSSSSYTLEVTVIDKRSLNNTATTKIVVDQSALVAAIDGGDRIVGISEPLILDASPSMDPDAPDDASGLFFEWSCEAGDSATTGAGGACTANMTGGSVQTLSLDAANLGLVTYTVVVSKLFRGVWRNATSSTVIDQTFDLVPPASIAALGVAKASPSEKLVLVGTVGPAELPVDASWSLASGGLVSGSLASSATTPLTDYFEVSRCDGSDISSPSE